MVQFALAKWGRIDILVNGAAGNFLVPFEQMSINAFRSVMEIDTFGTFHVRSPPTLVLQSSGGKVDVQKWRCHHQHKYYTAALRRGAVVSRWDGQGWDRRPYETLGSRAGPEKHQGGGTRAWGDREVGRVQALEDGRYGKEPAKGSRDSARSLRSCFRCKGPERMMISLRGPCSWLPPALRT